MRSLRLAVSLFALVAAFPAHAMSPPAPRQALRVFVTGPSESGKNHLLEHLFTSKTDRKISLDLTGEIARRFPDAPRTFGLEDLRDTLRRVASYQKWRIVAHIDEDEIAPLFRLLMPPIKSETTVSYPRAVGGLALECGEASWLAPSGRACKEVRAGIFSGRHHGLSTLLAAQQPTSVDPSVRGQAEILAAFGHREDLELDYWRKATSSAVAEIIGELPQYHSVLYSRASGRVYVLDRSYRPYRVLDLRGKDLLPRARPRLVGQS